MAYAPGIWSSYVYAGDASRAAYVLGLLKSPRAATYRKSAVRAMDWAERELAKKAGGELPIQVNDARNLAAVELYRLTGDNRWHKLFLDTTKLNGPKPELTVWKSHSQGDAAWVYLLIVGLKVDAALKTNCRKALLKEADQRVASCRKTGFRWAKHAYRPVGWGTLSAPDGVSLCRAYHLSGKEKYLRAAVLACQTGAGANPVNICYTTGLGIKSPRNPLHIDSRRSGQDPPPGLTVFGPTDTTRARDHWAQKRVNRFCYPVAHKWPTIEAYWDVFMYPSVCEYTVHSPMAQNAYVWGCLAARRGK